MERRRLAPTHPAPRRQRATNASSDGSPLLLVSHTGCRRLQWGAWPRHRTWFGTARSLAEGSDGNPGLLVTLQSERFSNPGPRVTLNPGPRVTLLGKNPGPRVTQDVPNIKSPFRICAREYARGSRARTATMAPLAALGCRRRTPAGLSEVASLTVIAALGAAKRRQPKLQQRRDRVDAAAGSFVCGHIRPLWGGPRTTARTTELGCVVRGPVWMAGRPAIIEL